MRVTNFNYIGTFNYGDNKENVVEKSKVRRIVLKIFTWVFKLGIFPAASIFKSFYLNKKRLHIARKKLIEMGGKPVKLQSPDKTTIDGMYLKADKFKEKIETYFDIVSDPYDNQFLVLKDEFINPAANFSADNFDHIVEGSVRDFCKTLSNLELGLNTMGQNPSVAAHAVTIPLSQSHMEKVTDEFREPRPVVLICPGRNMSFPAYKGMAAAYLMRGIDVMLFDYPGVGRSKGSPTDHNTKLATDTCFQYLRENRKKKPTDIIAHGHSLGSAFATDLASRRKGVHVVVDRGFSSFQQVVADKNPKLYRIVSCLLPKIANFNNKRNLKNVEGHIAIIQGKKDFVIPRKHANDNLQASRETPREDQVIKKMKADIGHAGNAMSIIPEKFDKFFEETHLNPGLFNRA